MNSSNFLALYKSFIIDLRLTMYKGTKFFYQKIPTFRVHLPKNLSVAEFHKDSDYSHDTFEINFFVPIVNCKNTATIWVENTIGKGDIAPVNLEYGQCLVFDGANLLHGNKINETGLTRLSFDFRLILVDNFSNNNKSTITINMPMKLGQFWDKL